jgi:hypothetical protein
LHTTQVLLEGLAMYRPGVQMPWHWPFSSFWYPSGQLQLWMLVAPAAAVEGMIAVRTDPTRTDQIWSSSGTTPS